MEAPKSWHLNGLHAAYGSYTRGDQLRCLTTTCMLVLRPAIPIECSITVCISLGYLLRSIVSANRCQSANPAQLQHPFETPFGCLQPAQLEPWPIAADKWILVGARKPLTEPLRCQPSCTQTSSFCIVAGQSVGGHSERHEQQEKQAQALSSCIGRFLQICSPARI